MESNPVIPDLPSALANPEPARPAQSAETPLPVRPPEPDPRPDPKPEPERRPARARRARKLKIMPAFWTIASLFSLVVNIILVVILIGLGTQLFTLKKLVQEQLLGGLYQNFVQMDQAHITTTIPISTNVPAKFTLPLKTDTVVILTEDTLLTNASVVSLQTGGLTIYNAPATIMLPAGTRLPVALDLTVPVDQMIPVTLEVKVDIPLNQTQLHAPFAGLQEVVRPYYKLLADTPSSWDEVLCVPGGLLCPQGH